MNKNKVPLSHQSLYWETNINFWGVVLIDVFKEVSYYDDKLFNKSYNLTVDKTTLEYILKNQSAIYLKKIFKNPDFVNELEYYEITTPIINFFLDVLMQNIQIEESFFVYFQKTILMNKSYFLKIIKRIESNQINKTNIQKILKLYFNKETLRLYWKEYITIRTHLSDDILNKVKGYMSVNDVDHLINSFYISNSKKALKLLEYSSQMPFYKDLISRCRKTQTPLLIG